MRYRIFTLFFTAVSAILTADFCIPYTEVGVGYDYFRSLPEGDWEGNTGALASINTSMPAPYLCDYGIGIQAGGSYGVYDWSGRGSSPSGRQTNAQQQVFTTAAIFRRTPCCSGINVGLAYDWMWNKYFSVFGLQSSFSQLRVQGGYVVDQTDEYGVWGTLDVHTSHRHSQGIPVSFRAISQVNLYWEHRYENCAKTMVWVGLPYKRSLMYSSGRAGKYILGASFHAPLSCRWSIDGHASYMRGHSAPGALKQRNYAANLCLELKWAFGDTECGFEPYMPIGNNSNFISDMSVNF